MQEEHTDSSCSRNFTMFSKFFYLLPFWRDASPPHPAQRLAHTVGAHASRVLQAGLDFSLLTCARDRNGRRRRHVVVAEGRVALDPLKRDVGSVRGVVIRLRHRYIYRGVVRAIEREIEDIARGRRAANTGSLSFILDAQFLLKEPCSTIGPRGDCTRLRCPNSLRFREHCSLPYKHKPLRRRGHRAVT